MIKVQNVRAVLWDVDGTLINSEEQHYESWREVLLKENFELDRERFHLSFGRRNDDVLRSYFGKDFPESEITRIGHTKETLYREMLLRDGLELLPGVKPWLSRLKQEGWRQSIASSAPLLNLETILDVLDLRSYFDAVVSAEMIERGKPDPQIFLTAASRVNVGPGRCVVVEDVPAGVEAAKRARMKVIGVLNTHSKLDADLVVLSLADLPENAFDRLLAEQ